MRSILKLLITIVFLLAAAGGGYWAWQEGYFSSGDHAVGYKTPAEQDPYVRFDMEAYDIIQTNYWQKASDADLSAFFAQSLAKADPTAPALATSTRTGVADMIAAEMKGKTADQKKDVAVKTLQVVLYNLAPAGHGELMTSQVQTDLKNSVANVNPAKDLYGSLGLQKGANVQEVDSSYQTQKAALAATTSPAGKQQLAALQHAHQVLTDPINKVIYDQTGAEPTIVHRIDGAHTLYIRATKIAPTTVYELASFLETASSTPGLNSLIIDLRGNLGGDLDFATNFMSLFYGPSAYAYDLFHQGDLKPQRTPQSPKLDSVSRFREIAILTDGMTQSTAELTAAIMQHAHLARLVGTKTRGWGSVEATYPLTTTIDDKEKYALLLVSYLTMRADGQPIEGNGVTPDVDTSVNNWKQQLPKYFYSSDLIAAIQAEIARTPTQ